MLLNAAKCQGYNFYCFWVIKGKTAEGDYPPPAQIRVKEKFAEFGFFVFYLKMKIQEDLVSIQY